MSEESSSSSSPEGEDYSYKFLLDRLYQEHGHQNNIANLSQLHLPPPRMARQGGARVVWINFPVFWKKLNRDVEHLKTYVLSELSTSGSIDGSGKLVIKGRFNEAQMQTMVYKYIETFVICKSCKGYRSELIKEKRLTRIKCLDCHSIFTTETLK